MCSELPYSTTQTSHPVVLQRLLNLPGVFLDLFLPNSQHIPLVVGELKYFLPVWERVTQDPCKRLPVRTSVTTCSTKSSTDAFSMNWKNLGGYDLPPFALISRCLHQVVAQEVITLVWTTQLWYPLLLELCVDLLLLLFVSPGLVSREV